MARLLYCCICGFGDFGDAPRRVCTIGGILFVGENIRGVGFLAIKYYATISKSMVMFFLTGLFGFDKHKLFAFL